MSVEKNLRLVDDAMGAFNAHDLDGFVGFYSESAVHYQPSRSEPLKGRSAIREDYLKTTFTGFPDIQFEKVRAFGQGDWVCVEGIFKGTHTGILEEGGQRIPATDKSVRAPVCIVFKVEGDKAMEVHEYIDQLGFFAQLGLSLINSPT